jgi:hypothetical protein
MIESLALLPPEGLNPDIDSFGIGANVRRSECEHPPCFERRGKTTSEPPASILFEAIPVKGNMRLSR